MYTREGVHRNFSPYTPERVSVPGYVRGEVRKGVVHTWPIARPTSGWNGDGSPYYVSGFKPNVLIHGGTPGLIPAKPRVAMDPMDRRTWQREYAF